MIQRKGHNQKFSSNISRHQRFKKNVTFACTYRIIIQW